MQFQVPQFIEVEDKIFGPLTLKQFIYLTGTFGLAFALYSLISKVSTVLGIIAGIPCVGFGLALAFYKFNEKPFLNIIESAVKFYFSEKLYIWKKKEETKPQETIRIVQQMVNPNFAIPKLSDSRLKDLTWSLDIKQSTTPLMNQKGQNNI
jgi:hypothetical protein